jgi:serine/threonine protein kinase
MSNEPVEPVAEDEWSSMLVACLEAIDKREVNNRQELLARYPHFAPQLNQFLAGEERLDRWTAPLRVALQAGSAPAAEQAASLLHAPRQLGDFRILRELGRGGMGVVYEAEQMSLGRRVALKVLPFAATMDSRYLQRFQNEARAAASLEHPHIVPVYGVGCERAVHYYAMKFIKGQSLAAIIEAQRQPSKPRPLGIGETQALPDGRGSDNTSPIAAITTQRAPGDAAAYRQIAEWGIQAAEALEHAHSLGIVHRDIKPANLMIDGHGSLWVTDFGLARTSADAGLTMTGDMLGTLRYMSPEQARAKHGLVDNRTDLYSLGVTLYELLTGTPAVTGTDREEILNRIILEDSKPPRSFDGSIPRDLETIVLKAMGKAPSDRYATARDLADDLRCFLEHKPIQARRPMLLARSIRFARRHQGAVLVALVMLLLVTAILAVSVVLLVNEKAKTNTALKRVDAKNRWARRAVNDMYSRVATKWLAHEPHMTNVQKEFLQRALEFYEELAAEESTDPEERLERAVAFRHMGDIRGGGWHRSAGGEESYRMAVRLCEELRVEFPENTKYREELGQCLRSLGRFLADHEQLGEAEQQLRRALALFSEQTNEFAALPEYLEDVGESHEDIGILWQRMGKAEQAEEALKKSIQFRKRLADNQADSAAAKERLAFGYLTLGELLANQRRLSQSEAALREALSIFERSLDASTTTPWVRSTLGGGGNNILADVLLDLHRPNEAEEAINRALAIRRKVNSDFPSSQYCWHGLAMTLSNRARILVHAGKHEAAREAFTEALHFQELVVADNPKHVGLRQNLALMYANLAWFGILRPTPELGARDALPLALKAKELVPDHAAYWTTVAIAHFRLERWDSATECLEKAVRLNDRIEQPLRGWVADTGILERMAERQARTALALNWFFTAMCQWRQGHVEEAGKSYRLAMQRWESQQIDEPSHVAELRATRREAAALLGLPAREAELAPPPKEAKP